MKQYILDDAVFSIHFLLCKTRTDCKTCNESGRGPNLKNVKVVNEDDPVCHMKTAEFFKRYSRL